jgi:epoxyqueuosine reductase
MLRRFRLFHFPMPITSLSQIWPELETLAREHHVARIGASSIEDSHNALFDDWIAAGHHASMSYLARNAGVRRDPSARFPWVRSVVVILVPYAAERPDAPPEALSHTVARYALGDDYHDVLDGILRNLESRLAELVPGTTTRRYVDTGPLSDRAYAAQAGLGWIGRNGMLIDQRIGSYFFIGTLLTSLENDLPSPTVADRCGTCTRCIDACPTDAILPNRTIASGACISHATIEHRGPLPDLFSGRLAGNSFGCDICQEVCPWNRDPLEPHPAFESREAYRATPVTDLLLYDQESFSALFRKSAIKRAKLAGMQRNVEALHSRNRAEGDGEIRKEAEVSASS